MPLPPQYNGGGVPWPPMVCNVEEATDPLLTPRPALSGLYKQTITAPAAADIDAFIGTPLAAGDTTTLTVEPGDAAWDGIIPTGVIPIARNVVVTVTHASSVVALSGVITGTDKYGKVITESWSVTATGTTKTYTGVKAFKTVTSITIVSAADATTDSVVFGTGKVFGLDFKSPLGGVATLVKELQDATILVTGTLVAASSAAAADKRGTYLPAGTPNGTISWTIWYIVDDFAALDQV